MAFARCVVACSLGIWGASALKISQGDAPSMGDLASLASQAEQFGKIYAAAAQKLPSATEQQEMIRQENAKERSHLDAEISHELQQDAEIPNEVNGPVALVEKAQQAQQAELASLPVIQLKLAPPQNPYPEVRVEIGRLEKERENAETAMQNNLHAAYNAALADAKSKISKVVLAVRGHRSAVAFLQRSEEDAFVVKVSLINPAPADSSILKSIDKIEKKRSQQEGQLFQQAQAEMSALTTFVLNQVRGAFKPNVAFLENLPPQANVRLSAADVAFPRIADMIQEMEMRRDSAENEERKLILETELRLLKAENAMVKEAVRGL